MLRLLILPLIWAICFAVVTVAKKVLEASEIDHETRFPVIGGYKRLLGRLFKRGHFRDFIAALESVAYFFCLLFAIFLLIALMNSISYTDYYDSMSHPSFHFVVGFLTTAFAALVAAFIIFIFDLLLETFPARLASVYVFLAVFFMWLFLPAALVLLWIREHALRKKPSLPQKSEPDSRSVENRLLRSLSRFKKTEVREIMTARSQIVALSSSTSVIDAWKICVEENFSRIPLFLENIDHISGALLYKDVMRFCHSHFEIDPDMIRTTKVSALMSPILFAPEGNKITDLFAEFRRKKIHAAIVVNEYGCTEGIVTIEDIIEELLGSEILDEHDEPEGLFFEQTRASEWIVDARMLALDAEREIGLVIPHNPEYETVGGFVLWKMGHIPEIGAVIETDMFKIEVLSSNERKIEKLKIIKKSTPISK